MTDLKAKLVKLGKVRTDLRPHIRPLLAHLNAQKTANVEIKTPYDRNFSWSDSPGFILTLAVRKGFLTEEEANMRMIQELAAEEANMMVEWPEDQGFGSSDMNALIRNILKAAKRKGFTPANPDRWA